MPINPIQIQRGLSLTDFLPQYGTETQCEAALFKARWPNGFRCATCEGQVATEFMRGKTTLLAAPGLRSPDPPDCGHHAASEPVDTDQVVLAIYLVTQSKTNIAALALMRQLDIS